MREFLQRLRMGGPVIRDQDTIARMLKPFIIALMGFVVIHGTALILSNLSRYRLLLLEFHLPVFLLLGISLILLARGHVKFALWLSLCAIFVGYTIGLSHMGGVLAPSFIGGYIMAVIISAVFLSYRASLLFTLAGVLIGLVFAILIQSGVIARPDMDDSPFIVWLAQALILAGVMELMRLATMNAGISFDHSRREQKYFQALIENSVDMVAVLDGLGRITYLSPSVGRIFGLSRDELVGKNGFDLLHPDDRNTVLTDFSRLVLKPGNAYRAEFRVMNGAGEWRWVEADGSNFLFDPDVQGVILNYRDITERKLNEERLAYDAIHDKLTGLPNRTLFLDRVNSRLRRSQRETEKLFAVLIIDIDHFKNINDSMGHSAGDQLLIEIGRRLERGLRSSDTVARLSGDEFGLLLDMTDDLIGAEQIVKRLMHEIREPLQLMDKELLLEASVGIVVGPGDYSRADDVLRDTEIAMYRAKNLGRARFAFFNDRMRSGVLERVGLEAEIRHGMKNNEFRVYYQPIYSLKTGILAGFEALLRWQHPERGFLLPGSFLDVAEESGLIIDLDRWVMREACRQLRVWQIDYPLGKSLIINVNLSRKHLTRGDLVDTVREILEDTGLDASQLRPEITESLFMESYEDAITIVRSLDRMGVRVEIDDFGSGHSSLALLAELNEVRTLKIDRQFVRSMHESPDRMEVIRMIISLGFSLKKEVIAEGIETQEQMENLRAMECEFGQGFYFSRGISPVEAGALIAIEYESVPFNPV
jgi:diguanylate cyclase (GGDEF)-like protein/PAS domain S-box-containing protein